MLIHGIYPIHIYGQDQEHSAHVGICMFSFFTKKSYFKLLLHLARHHKALLLLRCHSRHTNQLPLLGPAGRRQDAGGGGVPLFPLLCLPDDKGSKEKDDDDKGGPEDNSGKDEGSEAGSNENGSSPSVPPSLEPYKQTDGHGQLLGHLAMLLACFKVGRELGLEEVCWFFREDCKSWKPVISYELLCIECAFRTLLDPGQNLGKIEPGV
uniref:Uncharacterized protein n=1 Tax=Sphaerodactylus townsendi TaxID=933632 RepID=A0ACB8GBX0_9SAUR